MDNAIKEGRKKGVVQTIFGRQRKLRNINSGNGLLRSTDERNAINAPIQGSASDIIKLAMIRCRREFEKTNSSAKMILQVHDELVFDAPENEKDKLKEIIRKEMEYAAQLSVKLPVEIGEGKNWPEAH